MKWLVIVVGGVLFLYVLVKICHSFRPFRWCYSSKYRQDRKRYKELIGRRDYLKRELNRANDEIRAIR